MSDEQQPKRRKATITVTPRTEDTVFDVDSIIQRRLANPFAGGDRDIPIKNRADWDLYIATSEFDPNAHYEMQAVKGWVPVTVDDLPDGLTPSQAGWNVAEDGRTLCRGVRGQEIPYKMPHDVRQAILMRQDEINRKGTKSESQAINDVAEAAGGTFGSEAGDFVHRHVKGTLAGGGAIRDHRGPLDAG